MKSRIKSTILLSSKRLNPYGYIQNSTENSIVPSLHNETSFSSWSSRLEELKQFRSLFPSASASASTSSIWKFFETSRSWFQSNGFIQKVDRVTKSGKAPVFFNPRPGHVVATLDKTFYDDYLWFRTSGKFSGQDIEEFHRSIGPSKIPYTCAHFSEHLNYCLSQRTMCGLCRTINMQQLQISTKRSKIYLFAHYWW